LNYHARDNSRQNFDASLFSQLKTLLGGGNNKPFFFFLLKELLAIPVLYFCIFLVPSRSWHCFHQSKKESKIFLLVNPSNWKVISLRFKYSTECFRLMQTFKTCWCKKINSDSVARSQPIHSSYFAQFPVCSSDIYRILRLDIFIIIYSHFLIRNVRKCLLPVAAAGWR
jgi:hypothetical protein